MTDKHWLISPTNERTMRTACRAPQDVDNCTSYGDLVTCPTCLDTVIRVVCNAVADEPGPLPARCSRLVHDDGDHDWVPGLRVRRRADLQRQAVESATRAAIVANPQDAEEYAAAALREREQRRASEEQRLASLQEPAEETSPSDQLPVRKGVVSRVVARWLV